MWNDHQKKKQHCLNIFVVFFFSSLQNVKVWVYWRVFLFIYLFFFELPALFWRLNEFRLWGATLSQVICWSRCDVTRVTCGFIAVAVVPLWTHPAHLQAVTVSIRSLSCWQCFWNRYWFLENNNDVRIITVEVIVMCTKDNAFIIFAHCDIVNFF